MKPLPVNIAPHVQNQIYEQVLFIARDSIDHALAWEDRLRATMERIGNMPGYAVDRNASDYFDKIIRKVVFEGTYLIYYWVNEAAGLVEIMDFRHGARLPRMNES